MFQLYRLPSTQAAGALWQDEEDEPRGTQETYSYIVSDKLYR